MKANALIDRLEQNAHRINTLIDGVSAEEAVWKPSTDQWSILEVTAHLLDEEREDFRARLDLLLHRPGVLGPPINPQGWVLERKYNERNLQETLQSFLEERKKSLAWVRGLAAPAWPNALEHPKIGTIKAGDILGSWVAHDLLHMRQLTRLHWLYVGELAKPYSLGYAGDW
jgi:hypothetical protein